MADIFTPYETGLTRLVECLGSDHPRYADALTFQSRFLENIAQARQYGDTETRRAERAQIVNALNQLALETVGASFNKLCGSVRQIQLILEGEISDFTGKRCDVLLGVLASVLRVELSDIRILRVQPGSIRVIIEVPEEALTRLNSLSRTDISSLLGIGIQTIQSDAIGTLDLQSKTPDLLVMLFFNIVVVVVLVLIILGRRVSLPCVSPQASALSLAVIIVLLSHLVWRHFNLAIKQFSGTIKVGPLSDVTSKSLAPLLDALHPWRLSNQALWALAIVLFAATGILGLSPLSPFGVTETSPVIQNFLVHYADSHTETFAAGDLIELPADTPSLVEAMVSDQADVSCDWFAVKGTQIPAKGCATIYSPPFEVNRDALSVLAQSPCKTWQAFAGLHIKVVQVEP